MTTNHLILFIITTALLIPVAGCSQQDGNKASTNVSAAKALEMIKSDSSLVLLDVRTPDEFNGNSGHLPGATLIPVQELKERMGELEPLKSRPILVYCRSGSRSSKAVEILAENGFNLFMLDGGIIAWNKAGNPVEGGNTR